MSHFTVMVIGENVDEQLAPYQENNMGDCPEEYLEFNNCTEDVQRSWDRLEIPVTNGKDLVKNGHEDVRIYWSKDSEGNRTEHAFTSMKEFAKWYYGWEPNEYGQYGYWENPNAKWDWYKIGGRWSNFFLLKNGAKGMHGEPSLLMKDFKHNPKYADSVRKGDVDFEGMFNKQANIARERYEKVKAIIGDDPDHLTWEELKERNDTSHKDAIDKLRDKYWSQPMCKRWKASDKIGGLMSWQSSPDDYLVSIDEYANKAGASSFLTFAYLYKGEWHARGDMAMFAIVYNEKDDWEIQFMEFLQNLPDDELLTVVDCHI